MSNDKIDSSLDIKNFGFKTATGKNINIKEDSLKLAKEKFFENTDSMDLESTATTGFKTVTGKPIEIKKDTLETLKNIFDKEDDGLLANNSYKKNGVEAAKQPITSNLPSTTNGKKMLDGKHFKKPQLIQKSKLNKYIETSTNNDSLNKTEDLQLTIKSLFKEELSPNEDEEKHLTPPLSNSSEFRLNFSSEKLNGYLKKNEFLFNPQKLNKVTYFNVNDFELKEISGMEKDSKMTSSRYLVKPILELKIADVE